jgi:hypothetical protein
MITITAAAMMSLENRCFMSASTLMVETKLTVGARRHMTRSPSVAS